MLTRLAASHRNLLADLLRATPEFSTEDKEVALELIDCTLATPDSYRFWVDEDGDGRGGVRGYICYGATPMTKGTFDLYWIATHPAHKGKGVGRGLVRAMEQELEAEGGRLVRVETAGSDEYEATRAFYDRIGYQVVARIRDFYWPGNDLYIYGRYL